MLKTLSKLRARFAPPRTQDTAPRVSYVVCRNRKIVSTGYTRLADAERETNIMNGIAGRNLYHVHPESELDRSGCGPCADYLHTRALPQLAALAADNLAADNPRLRSLLDAIEHDHSQGGLPR